MSRVQVIKGGLIGILGFAGSALVTSLLLSQEMIPILIAAFVGSLLLFLGLGYRQGLLKNTVLSMVALVVAFLVGFGLGEVSTLLPIEEGYMANALFFVVAGAVYSILLGILVHGTKSIGFFAGVGLLISIVFTIIVFLAGLLQGAFWNGIDLNLLVILGTLGGVAGMSLGTYQMKN